VCTNTEDNRYLMLFGTSDTIGISFVDCQNESASRLDVNGQLE
jgi:hypothetical protein